MSGIMATAQATLEKGVAAIQDSVTTITENISSLSTTKGSVVVVLGAQWGDEGKGKLVDILCGQMKLVARAAGGNNAGHTIVVNGITYDFHLLPSGLINPECMNLLGSGMVVSVSGLFKELGLIEAKGLKGAAERVRISDRAQIALDLHAAVDGLEEAELQGKKIGTTGKGIGPAYSTKHARSGLRVSDIFDVERFEENLRRMYNGYKKRYGDLLDYDVEDEIARFREYRPKLLPMKVDAVEYMIQAQESNLPILVEGANAIMLDIDYGTYPYVTSSSTGLGGVFTGLGGLSPHAVKTVYGVLKAYTTRVGGGPFPTEDLGDVGNTLQEVGREFGVTTGRRRRCGWLDLVVAKYSARLNHYTHINVTKLDILDTFKTIKVATAYLDKATKKPLASFPADLNVLANVEVEYKELQGWNTPTTHCKRFEDLPKAAQDYVVFIEKFLSIPVSHIGTGPRREDMIVR